MRARGSSPRWPWLIGLALLAGCDDAADPLLRAALPERAAPGAPVDVIGERLEGGALVLSFGGRPAEVTLRQPARLRASVPALPPGLTSLVVTVDGRVSNALTFTVLGTLDAGP